jgi:hypothetical protein
MPLDKAAAAVVPVAAALDDRCNEMAEPAAPASAAAGGAEQYDDAYGCIVFDEGAAADTRANALF